MTFFRLFFLLVGPICAAVAYRTVVRALRLERAWRHALVIALLLCSLKFTWFALFGGHIFLPELPVGVIYALSVCYDFVLFLTVLGVVWAAGRWVVRRARGARPTGGPDLSRRRMVAGALACVAAGTGAKAVHNGFRLPDVVEVTLEFPDLPSAFDGYRVAHLSDLHVSAAARAERTAGVVRLVNAQSPDLIAITGDLVDGTASRRLDDVAPLGKLRAADGVVGCTGNHEYFSGWGTWRVIFRSLGIRILENERVVVRRGEESLAIIGINDPVSHDSDIRIASDMLPDGAFRILLAHRPTHLAEHAACGVRLQLSGHTHGGAGIGLDRLVARANEGHVRGLYSEHGISLYVNSGTGQWAGFPTRLGVSPEITIITLRRTRRELSEKTTTGGTRQ
jgi:predicted MPP superfamily phosphohydrolase